MTLQECHTGDIVTFAGFYAIGDVAYRVCRTVGNPNVCKLVPVTYVDGSFKRTSYGNPLVRKWDDLCMLLEKSKEYY